MAAIQGMRSQLSPQSRFATLRKTAKAVEYSQNPGAESRLPCQALPAGQGLAIELVVLLVTVVPLTTGSVRFPEYAGRYRSPDKSQDDAMTGCVAFAG